jgi:hypothetical protein
MQTLRRLLIATALWLLTALDASAGAVRVEGAWARATPPGTEVAAVYLTLHGGAQADRLLSASTPDAAQVFIHTVGEQRGMSAMRELDGLELPAGKPLVLAPLGTHLMLSGLRRALRAGETLTMELRFARGGTRRVTVTIIAPGAAPPAAAPPGEPNAA